MGAKSSQRRFGAVFAFVATLAACSGSIGQPMSRVEGPPVRWQAMMPPTPCPTPSTPALRVERGRLAVATASTSIPAIQTLLSCTSTCSGSCAGAQRGKATYWVITNLPSPVASGATRSTLLQLASNPSYPSNVLYYSPHLGAPPPGATSATWTFDYMINQPVWKNNRPTFMNALEFDFNVVDQVPNYTFNFSSHCVFPTPSPVPTPTSGPTPKPGPSLQPQLWLWSGGGTRAPHWVPTAIACNSAFFTPATWHTVVWKYKWNTTTRVGNYVSLTIDATPLVTSQNWTSPNPVESSNTTKNSPFVEVQFQQDMKTVTTSPAQMFKEWIDKVGLSIR